MAGNGGVIYWIGGAAAGALVVLAAVAFWPTADLRETGVAPQPVQEAVLPVQPGSRQQPEDQGESQKSAKAADPVQAADEPAEAGQSAAAAPEPPAAASSTETGGAEEVAENAELERVPAPSVDHLRFDPEGVSILAGRAFPGAKIDILLDGVAIASVVASSDGSFATPLDLGASGQAQTITLSAMGPEGDVTEGDGEWIIAPVAQSMAVAEGPAEIRAETPDSAPEQETTEAAEAIITEQPTDQLADAAPADAVVLKSDAEGVSVVTPAPRVTSSIAIDLLSYSAEGSVSLQGRAQQGADAVRVYVDNAPVAILPVDETGGWRGNLPEIETGVYTLRVDEVQADGVVSSRVETPFKREDPSTIDTVTARATQVVTVQPGSTLWAIARDRYGEGIAYVQVFEANRDLIRDPDLIYPGQVFTLPEDG